MSMLHDARRAPMLVAIAALVACTPDTGVSTPSLTAASGGVAAFAAAMSALGAGRRTPPPEAPMFGCAAVGTTNPCKLAAVRAALATIPRRCCPTMPAARRHWPCAPLSPLGGVRAANDARGDSARRA